MRGLLLLFIVLPIAELMLLLKVGSLIGVLPTLAIVISTAFIGINVLKRQGFSTLNRAQRRMQSGQLPAQELVEGFMLAIGGALLLTPGFITDVLGFTLLLPWSRQALARYLIKTGRYQAWNSMGAGGGFTVFTATNWKPPADRGEVLDGEVIRETVPKDKIQGP